MEIYNKMDFSHVITTAAAIMATNNGSDPSGDVNSPLYPKVAVVFICLVVATIIMMTVVGNVFVIMAYYRDPRIREKVANLLILNLAITDLIVGGFSLIFNFSRFIRGYWPYGETVCKLWTIIDFTVCWMSIITIVLISWDRYTLVSMGIKYQSYQTKKRVGMILISCWIFVITYWSLIAFGWGPIKGTSRVDYEKACRMEFNYTYLAPLFINLIPFSILVTIAVAMNVGVYINIHRRSKRRMKPCHGFKTPPTQSVTQATNESLIHYTPPEGSVDLEVAEEAKFLDTKKAGALPVGIRRQVNVPDYSEIARSIKKEKLALSGHRRAAIVLSILTGLFIVFWLPYKSMTVVFSICGSGCVSNVLWEFTEVLAWCNSTINPVIYAAFNVHFRKNFRYFLQLDRWSFDVRRCKLSCKACGQTDKYSVTKAQNDVAQTCCFH